MHPQAMWNYTFHKLLSPTFTNAYQDQEILQVIKNALQQYPDITTEGILATTLLATTNKITALEAAAKDQNGQNKQILEENNEFKNGMTWRQEENLGNDNGLTSNHSTKRLNTLDTIPLAVSRAR